MTYGVPAGIIPADVASVSAVSDVRTETRYHVVICDGSVEPKPMRAPIATLFVAN